MLSLLTKLLKSKRYLEGGWTGNTKHNLEELLGGTGKGTGDGVRLIDSRQWLMDGEQGGF
jgi:hypothetical protein